MARTVNLFEADSIQDLESSINEFLTQSELHLVSVAYSAYFSPSQNVPFYSALLTMDDGTDLRTF